MIITITSNLSGLTKDFYEAPKGYTLEDLFATVKYYVEHPNERPHSDSGWGNASDHVQRNQNGQADTNQTEKTIRGETSYRKTWGRKTSWRETSEWKPESQNQLRSQKKNHQRNQKNLRLKPKGWKKNWEAEELLAKIKTPLSGQCQRNSHWLKITCYLAPRTTILLWQKLKNYWLC